MFLDPLSDLSLTISYQSLSSSSLYFLYKPSFIPLLQIISSPFLFLNIMAALDPAPILQHPSEDDLFQGVPKDVKDYRLKHWDKGVFSLELLNLSITPPTVDISDGVVSGHIKIPPGQVKEGTYSGTQLALTEMFSRIEKRYDKPTPLRTSLI